VIRQVYVFRGSQNLVAETIVNEIDKRLYRKGRWFSLISIPKVSCP
jgi:hypothetical protein